MVKYANLLEILEPFLFMAGEVKVVNNLSYGDYCDAGKPYGKQGYPKWIHEEYNKRIAELEAEKKDYKDAININVETMKILADQKAELKAERDQLAASLETARKALTNIRDYIRSNSGADWDNVRAFCLEALAQGTHRL